jgi:hypothetical protein
VAGKEDGGGISGKFIKTGLFRRIGGGIGGRLRLGSLACCFSLALLSEVAMFELFQCFSTFKHMIYI